MSWAWIWMPAGGQGQAAHPQVAQLNQVLAYYRHLETEKSWVVLPADIRLGPSDSSHYIPQLRKNLFLTGDLSGPEASASPFFDLSLTQAVIRFQKRHGLRADGIVGPSTVAALNVPLAQRIRQLELNLRRWQADTLRLPGPRLVLNIPDFSLQLLDARHLLVWQTRVVVGAPDKERQTPLLNSKISYLVINPSWNLPPGIIRREILPALRKDPHYLARNHMTLYRVQGTRKLPVSALSVNWKTADLQRDSLMIIQAPGKENALGLVKFIFDNPYQVYLHDTPHKNLFRRHFRAYSSGCVRVEDPATLAAYLLNRNWQKPPAPLVLKPGKEEKMVYLPRPMPIQIAYFTSWVNQQGEVEFRPDIYNLDSSSNDL